MSNIKSQTIFWLTLFSVYFAFSQEEYFQQKVDYHIEVTLDDQQHFLHGFEKVQYTNNSLETLKQIHFHLWPNAYKNNKTPFHQQQIENGSSDFHFAKKENRGYIDSLSFEVDGKSVLSFTWDRFPDMTTLQLNTPLQPGQTITISTPFRVKIPASFSRLGHVGQQYQITQWYPKPAVYDREGWHPMSYLDQGEFYSEFGSFDVFITLPKNYVVGATGDLPMGDPEYQWLEAREKLSRTRLASEVQDTFEQKFLSTELKTLHFHQENVHDFAWFCDKNYYVLSDTARLSSGKEVRVVALFGEKDKAYWANATNYLKRSVQAYSDWVGEYPYNHATAVDGRLSAGAGMEYPNITVVGAGRGDESLDIVITHEVGHNWFYGILGSNERDHPWLDEGLNSYLEHRYWSQNYKGATQSFPKLIAKFVGVTPDADLLQKGGYKLSAGENKDQPVTEHSEKLEMTNYGTMVYMKTAMFFQYLEGYLGRELMEQCFHTYFDEWKFKHPGPNDLQRVFEKVSGQNLAWFFEELLPGTDKLDFKVMEVSGSLVKIRNSSSVKLPVHFVLETETGERIKEIWTAPFSGTEEFETEIEGFSKVVVNPDYQIPELYEGNNLYRVGAPIPRLKTPRVNFLYKFPSPGKFDINVLPVLGTNTTDHFMFGALFYHGLFPKSKFEFHAMPMFATGTLDIRGSAGLTFRIFPKKVFHKIEFRSRSSFFSDLIRTRNFIEFHNIAKNRRNSMQRKLSLNLHHVGYRVEYQNYLKEYWKPVYGSINFEMKKRNAISSFLFQSEVGTNITEKMSRFSTSTDYTYKYHKRGKVSLRGFVGAIASKGDVSPPLAFGLAGSEDPFGQTALLDRNDKVHWINQIVEDQGGFRHLAANNPRYDQFLGTVNIDIQPPVKILNVFWLFGDVGVGKTYYRNAELVYGAGVKINILNETLNIHFPVVGSGYENHTPSSFKDFVSNISFSYTVKNPLSYLGLGN